MNTLVVGFDSAWTAKNSGGIVGVVCSDDGGIIELGPPQTANYQEAEAIILQWQTALVPRLTVVMLDQPTIVNNAAGQRPVENIVSSPISLRGGGVQPANTGKAAMFGADAPVWAFLQRFGGAADPLAVTTATQVYETYPVLALIALGWTLPEGKAGRLPKYNPARRKTFSIPDWQHVCTKTVAACREFGLEKISAWVDQAGQDGKPRKEVQDCLDACICLLVGLQFAVQKNCLMIGDLETGYMIVPASPGLQAELASRCRTSDRDPAAWIRLVPDDEPIAPPLSPLPEHWSQPCLPPEAFDQLRTFSAKVKFKVLRAGSLDFMEAISEALPKAVEVVCRVDEAKLRKELLARGVPEEQIGAICRRLTIEGKFEVRDGGLPFHLRKNSGANF